MCVRTVRLQAILFFFCVLNCKVLVSGSADGSSKTRSSPSPGASPELLVASFDKSILQVSRFRKKVFQFNFESIDSMSKNFLVEELPCRRTSLSKSFLVKELPCRRTSLSENFFVEELPCRRTSLSKNVYVRGQFASLLKVWRSYDSNRLTRPVNESQTFRKDSLFFFLLSRNC